MMPLHRMQTNKHAFVTYVGQLLASQEQAKLEMFMNYFRRIAIKGTVTTYFWFVDAAEFSLCQWHAHRRRKGRNKIS